MEVDRTVTDPPTNELTRRIDAAIAEVYRSDSPAAARILASFGHAAVDRVLELYRGSTTGPQEHARLLNAMGNAAGDARANARRAVARACPHRYVDNLRGRLDAADISVVADIHDRRITALMIDKLGDLDQQVRYRATVALLGRITGDGNDDRQTRELAQRAVIGRLDDEALQVRMVAAYAVARRSRTDGIAAYQHILRPTEPETLLSLDVGQRIAALRRGEEVLPPTRAP